MAQNRVSKGITIPDIFIRNDGDSVATGQVDLSKAGTVALSVSGSDAKLQLSGSQCQVILSGDTPSVRLSGAGGKFYLANSGGTVGTLTLGAGNALTFAIQATTGTLIDL